MTGMNIEPQARREADTDLVELDNVALRGGDDAEAVSLYAPGVFLRTARTVSRVHACVNGLTFRARAIPRREMRSARAAAIRCSFSGVTVLLWGLRVKVLPQSLQRVHTSVNGQRALPQGLVPWRITRSVP